MFRLIKKCSSNHTKSLKNQKFMTHPTLINLHPNEYSQEFQYYPFVVKLDRCVGWCNTLNVFVILLMHLYKEIPRSSK